MTLSRDQLRTQQLSQLLRKSAGRAKLAASLGPSLRRRRDYMSIARQSFMIETLPDGALPIYDKEFDVSALSVGTLPGGSFVDAYVIGEEGASVAQVVKPKRVTVPTFEITALPMIPITQIKERRFDIVQRALNLAKAEIGVQEDKYIFILFDTAAVDANNSTSSDSNPQLDPLYNPDLSISGVFDFNSFADAVGQIERHDLPFAKVYFNPRDYTDLRKWTQSNIDRETERTLLKTGVMGTVFGGTIQTSRKVPYGTAYFLSEPEFIGVIPERIPLTVMSADRPDLRQIGFSVFEDLGFYFFNPSGSQRVLITRSYASGSNAGTNEA